MLAGQEYLNPNLTNKRMVMVKQFELSTYGMEELNRQELREINGGTEFLPPVWVWIIMEAIGLTAAGITIYQAARAGLRNDGTVGPTLRMYETVTKEYGVKRYDSSGKEYYTADSVIIYQYKP